MHHFDVLRIVMNCAEVDALFIIRCEVEYLSVGQARIDKAQRF